MKKKIMIFSTSGIGNAILSVPLIKNLKKTFPASELSFTTASKQIYDLFVSSPYIGNIYLLDKDMKKDILINPLKFCREFKKILNIRKENYELVIFPFSENNDLLLYLIGKRKRVIHNYNSKLRFLNKNRVLIKETHDVQQNLNLLKFLNIKSRKEKLELWLDKNDVKYADNFFKNINKRLLIGFHPGGSNTLESMLSKRWPAKNFSKLADLLIRKYNSKVLVFIGPDEEDLEQYFAKNKNIQIIKGLPINKVIALISRCNYFVSNDSGLMHIATALDVPVLAIFGSTDPARTHPWGRYVLVQTKLKCAPCAHTIKNLGKEFRCIYKSPKCMSSISVDKVFIGFNKLRKKFSMENMLKNKKRRRNEL